MQKFLIPLFALAFLLSACNTTVVTDEERELPDSDEAMEDVIPTDEVPDNTPPLIPTLPTGDVGDEAPVMENTGEESMVVEADLSQSFIAFTGKKGSLSSHEGKFNDYTVTLSDVNNVAGASLNVSIVIGSMVTDSAGLTKHLLNEDFFDEPNYPTATFESTAIEGSGSEYSVTGMLTMHGVTKKVTFPATITDSYMTVNTSIDRTAFGIGGPAEGVKAIDADVPLEIKIVWKK